MINYDSFEHKMLSALRQADLRHEERMRKYAEQEKQKKIDSIPKEYSLLDLFGIGKKPGPRMQKSEQNKTWEENHPGITESYLAYKGFYMSSGVMARLKKEIAAVNSQFKRKELSKDVDSEYIFLRMYMESCGGLKVRKKEQRRK